MRNRFKTGLALASTLAGLMITPAHAAVDKGDTAFMIVSSVLVLLMTIPGLALFYGGLVRTKNMLGTLAQVFVTVCLVCVLWLVCGYSLTFTNGETLNNWIGGLSKAFLWGVTPASEVATFTNGVMISELAFVCFQMMFAAITPALIVGAFAERIKFSALLLFMMLWVTFVYFPIAHMVWYWPGPDEFAKAARAVEAATGAEKLQAEAALEAVKSDAGLMFQFGAIDFAGGLVVHINCGVAGLVGALMLGPRLGYGREPMPPHALATSMIGAALLWVGWFGFNAGSALEANGTAALAMTNTFAAAATATLGWMFAEWILKGKPSLLGMTSGLVAGLVAVTPASGYAGPMGALGLGVVAGVVCFIFCTGIKNAAGYDDSLDVFGVHCIGGIIGGLATGLLVDPMLGGTGISDYIVKPGEAVVVYDRIPQMVAQAEAVGLTIVWSAVGSLILFKVVDVVVGLRLDEQAERTGLDLSAHGERAYYP